MDRAAIWKHNYIDGIDISNIEWIKLEGSELEEFFRENYFDEEEMQFVRDKFNTSPLTIPLGMHYIAFTYVNTDYKFILGVVPNNINKKTIVAAMMYLDNYYLYTEQKRPITYISSVEVNSYFWNKGIYKRLCEEVINYIKTDQHIMISKESAMGRICGTISLLESALLRYGFDKNFIVDDYFKHNNPEYKSLICDEGKSLKKTISVDDQI